MNRAAYSFGNHISRSCGRSNALFLLRREASAAAGQGASSTGNANNNVSVNAAASASEQSNVQTQASAEPEKTRPEWLRLMKNKHQIKLMEEEKEKAFKSVINNTSSKVSLKDKVRGIESIEFMKAVDSIIESLSKPTSDKYDDYLSDALLGSKHPTLKKKILDSLKEYKELYDKDINIVTNVDLELAQIEVVENIRSIIDTTLRLKIKDLIGTPLTKSYDDAGKAAESSTETAQAAPAPSTATPLSNASSLDEESTKFLEVFYGSLRVKAKTIENLNKREQMKSGEIAPITKVQKYEDTAEMLEALTVLERKRYLRALDIINRSRAKAISVVDAAISKQVDPKQQPVSRDQAIQGLIKLYISDVEDYSTSEDFIDFSEFASTKGVTKTQVFTSPIQDIFAAPNQLSDFAISQKYAEYVADNVLGLNEKKDEKSGKSQKKDGSSKEEDVPADKVDPFNVRLPLGVRPNFLDQPKPTRPAVLVSHPNDIHFTNTWLLSRFLSRTGQILPRRETGLSAKMQRKLAKTVKRARQMGLLSYRDRYLPYIDMNIPGQSRPNTLAPSTRSLAPQRSFR